MFQHNMGLTNDKFQQCYTFFQLISFNIVWYKPITRFNDAILYPLISFNIVLLEQ